MRRRDFLQKSVFIGAASTLPLAARAFGLTPDAPQQPGKEKSTDSNAPSSSSEPIPVAFVISKGAVVIDFCGPWEVFQDTNIPGQKQRAPAFSLYTVADSLEPVQASAGMRILPDYTFDNAPKPRIIVIPGQRGQTDAMLKWI